MFDLYLFNTIINTIWYIFTILFVLYRFTSLFSYIYNFSRFCGKLFTGVRYIYNYTTTNRYQNIGIDIESQSRPKSTFQKFKEMCKKKWYQLFNKSSPEVILKYETVFPLVEITTLHNSSGYQPNSSGYQPNSKPDSFNNTKSSMYFDEPKYSESNSVLEKQLFDRKIDELMDEDSLYYDPNYQSVSLSDNKIDLYQSGASARQGDFDSLHAISDKMDELDKEEKRSLEKLQKSKKVRFNIEDVYRRHSEYESDSESELPKSKKIRFNPESNSEYESNDEYEPLFHK